MQTPHQDDEERKNHQREDGEKTGREAFLAILRAKRAAVAHAGERLRRRDATFTLVSVIASAVAAALTAGPALGGPALTRALGSAGPDTPSWRILCGVASVCSLLAAVAANLHRQQEVTTRLARCQTGAARLEALELRVALEQGLLAEATAEYGRVIAELPFVTDP
jgi:MFS family permease